LAKLSEHPKAGSIFGADGHYWLAVPPLTDDELADLESQLAVDLPHEYRALLLQVSREGVGPTYGLSHYAGAKAVGVGKGTAQISQTWKH
jgi:hypothetical protein